MTTIFERFDENFCEFGLIGFGSKDIKAFLRTELEALAKECIGEEEKPILESENYNGNVEWSIGFNAKRHEVIAAFNKIGITPPQAE